MVISVIGFIALATVCDLVPVMSPRHPSNPPPTGRVPLPLALRVFAQRRSAAGRVGGCTWMCIQIRQILARVSVAFPAAHWNGENGTRPFPCCLPASCLPTMTLCPFFPPLRCSLRSIDFPFPFLPRSIARVFGATLPSGLMQFNNCEIASFLSFRHKHPPPLGGPFDCQTIERCLLCES